MKHYLEKNYLVYDSLVQRRLERSPLFTPTRILVQPEVAAEFEALEIADALARHLHGDFGEWAVEAAAGFEAGDRLDCYYLTDSGYWLRLLTSADRATTRIVIGCPGEDDADEGDAEEE